MRPDQTGQEVPALEYSSTRSNAIYYGVNLTYQLLPLLTGQRKLRFELYPVVKLGFVSEFWKSPLDITPMSPLVKHSNTKFEIGAGLGAGYRFTRNFGMFGEAAFGNFYNDQKFRFHAGIQFNF